MQVSFAFAEEENKLISAPLTMAGEIVILHTNDVHSTFRPEKNIE